MKSTNWLLLVCFCMVFCGCGTLSNGVEPTRITCTAIGPITKGTFQKIRVKIHNVSQKPIVLEQNGTIALSTDLEGKQSIAVGILIELTSGTTPNGFPILGPDKSVHLEYTIPVDMMSLLGDELRTIRSIVLRLYTQEPDMIPSCVVPARAIFSVGQGGS
jgi:hypothetical protein